MGLYVWLGNPYTTNECLQTVSILYDGATTSVTERTKMFVEFWGLCYYYDEGTNNAAW